MEIGWERRSDVYHLDVSTLSSVFQELIPNCKITNYSILSGGLSNTNYKVCIEGYECAFVLRISRADDSWVKESSILNRLKNIIPLPELIYSSNKKTLIDKCFSIYKFIPGETLAQKIHTGYVPSNKLASEIGKILARIHKVEFKEIGLLNSEITKVSHEEPLNTWIEKYAIIPIVKGLAGRRIAPKIKQQTISYLEKQQPLFNTPTSGVLTHGDFKPTNIVINKNQVVGILDWEFSFSAPWFFDIGQMLRYEKELPSILGKEMLGGYESVCVFPIDKNWRELSKTVDLINLIGFLNSKEERPRVFDDVNELIYTTIKGPKN